jgi:hypothetical protein
MKISTQSLLTFPAILGLWIAAVPLMADTAASGAPAPSVDAQHANSLSPIPNGQVVVDQFRASYEKQQKPRILVYINRELVPENRLVLTARTEKSTQVKGDVTEKSGNVNVQVGSNNTKEINSGGTILTINPRETGAGGEKKESTSTYSAPTTDNDLGITKLTTFDMRQLEETFRRPYFAAGARFVDQRIAATLLRPFSTASERFLTAPTTDQEKAQFDALKQCTDIVIELLARHYEVSHPTPAGDSTIRRLDIVATAFDMKQPGLVLGQISSETLFGFNQPGGTRRPVTDLEIIDQTALALMQQLTH